MTSVEVVDAETSGPLATPFLRVERPAPGFLGVSVRNRMSNRAALQALIPWFMERVTSGCIVIGDYPHRHNLNAIRGLCPESALRKAMAAGRRPRKTAESIVASSQDIGRINVISAADVIETTSCRAKHHAISHYYNSNALAGTDFVRDVLRSALQYAQRVQPDLPRSHIASVLPVLKDYVLEELAMFLELHSLGHFVEVYPGPDLRLMRRIARREYIEFPVFCAERTHISVKVTHVDSDGSGA